MNFTRSLVNLTLGAIGGILGNLLAAWIQQEAWGNLFTLERVLATIAGFMLVILFLAWLDTRSRHDSAGQAPNGIHDNVQVGNPLIRVFKGTNVYRNIQIGGGRIEVIDDSHNPESDHNV